MYFAWLAQDQEMRAGLVRAGLTQATHLLDAGCGPGVITRVLAELAGADVVGIDTMPSMLEFGRSLPSPESGSTRFEDIDVLGRLPFEDDSFDGVFLGDLWAAKTFPELRRVTRPGGRIVLKLSGVLPELTYVWDKAFDLHMRQAAIEGSDRCFGPALHGIVTLRRDFEQAGPWQALDAFGIFIEQFAPVPAVFEAAERQLFARSLGPILREVLPDREWRALADLWDSTSERYLFRNPAGHFVRGAMLLVGQLPA